MRWLKWLKRKKEPPLLSPPSLREKCVCCLELVDKLYTAFDQELKEKICMQCKIYIYKLNSDRVKKVREIAAQIALSASRDPYRGQTAFDPSHIWDMAKKLEAADPFRIREYDKYMNM